MRDVVVFGSGALGSLFAARLARTGGEVTVASAWPDGLEAIRAHGLTVEDPDSTWRARVAALPRHGPLPRAGVVLVLVKAHQTAAVAADVRRAAAPGSLIVTLQNGRGNVEALQAVAGPGHVVAGLTTAGALLVRPGRVRSFPGTVVLGRGGAAEAVDAFAGLLRTAGLATTALDDAEPALWLKLAVNCAINPVSALAGLPNGALLADPVLRERMSAAAHEVSVVARARGIDLGADPAGAALAVASATASNRSSMLQDLDHGRPTEIDALCGAVCEEGRRLGVPTPIDARLWMEVLERSSASARAARARA